MVLARIILGFGVGAAAATVPLYLAEMAPVHRRGRMVTINELMIVTGQLLAFAMNALLDQIIEDPNVWRSCSVSPPCPRSSCSSACSSCRTRRAGTPSAAASTTPGGCSS